MSTDILGFVEVRASEGEPWRATASLYDLVGQDYDLFGLLFDVRNTANFEPLFAQRGVPDDISPAMRAELDEWDWAVHSMSTVSADEFDILDAPARGPDRRIHIFRPGPDGAWQRVGRALHLSALKPHMDVLAAHGEVVVDGTLYRRVTLRRRDVLQKPSWQAVLTHCQPFIAAHGAANVRLVVGFD